MIGVLVTPSNSKRLEVEIEETLGGQPRCPLPPMLRRRVVKSGEAMDHPFRLDLDYIYMLFKVPLKSSNLLTAASTSECWLYSELHS